MDELVVEFLHKTRVDIHVNSDSDDDRFINEQTAAAKKRRRLKLISVLEKRKMNFLHVQGIKWMN